MRRAIATVAAVCLLLLATATRAAALDPFTGYLLAHFVGESSTAQQIYLAHSKDGLHWTDLNNGGLVLRSTVGTKGVRDPSLVRSPAGDRYWIIATDLCISCGQDWSTAQNNGSRNLVVWESTDLVTWSAPWLLNVAGAIPDGRNAWAPEAIWNPATNDYVLYWATNATLNGVLKHRIYSARTSNFRSITTPQLYIDRAGTQGIIDTQIIEVPTGSYRYVRASGDGQITIEGSNSILGTWTNLGNLSGIGLTGSQVEGPMWMKFNTGGDYALYLDQYASGRGYLPVLTTNPATPPGSYRIPAASTYALGGTKKRHGAILNLTAAEESRVLARWPSNVAVNRIQSYNFQDRYVRHTNFDVRIDPNVSPAQDAQFRLVPGINGASGTISFESVNFPGYYLRHVNYDFVLAANDGTGTFAGDATFRQVAGLASSSWTSFQSYNFPDRYIRHYNYQLRLDPITDATGRADATFRITT
ncbi:glycoside hydrolase family 43 protein [Dactylosporangium sp. AC04546]|uniref:glycoside hydrolase family 43 protein n=1 Tax=Dactylosporangium sp. AC04546 TaxID=2862460 RepID=UPI001EE0F382|nr:glycoside hydrolase family 43 protein [Dactylosporangium sp. AC04546]WVK86305.1 glycoside hydrolase family 43 protein [Dactylosporangium sp. AC04546]